MTEAWNTQRVDQGYDVDLRHTAGLMHAERAAIRELLFEVFDDMDDDDWEHALGGLHATIWDTATQTPLAHASLVQRRLLHGGRALRAGYVEAVAVRPSHRRRGLGGRVVGTLDSIIDKAYEIGGLGATDEAVALYESRGWRRWEGRAFALTPDGVVETPDDVGAIFVREVVGVPLDLTGGLTCDWREGDVW